MAAAKRKMTVKKARPVAKKTAAKTTASRRVAVRSKPAAKVLLSQLTAF